VKFGIVVTTGEPAVQAELAAEAEAAGWDGVFTWDGMALGSGDVFDPWVIMAAMAVRTQRVRLGAIVTPPARRRPWKLARETMTLDRLSNGRLVLPVGLGTLDDAGFGNVGEPTEARTRAERLDESLAILEGLWSGEPFGFDGSHYRFEPMTFRPTPIQQPRIPVWVIGAWPHERSMRRALRWDGVYAQTAGPENVRAVAEYVARERPADLRDRAFDIVVEGSTDPADPAAIETVRANADAGATWWIEADWNHASTEAVSCSPRASEP
jgi:alkanesulfonate monooxygenase SsuD/methylene tetrahydromethanopterin reductase-like flavin-dependent oxidoreductase (luciferase family)